MAISPLALLVRRRRLELRLTQREAARRSAVSLATWQALERHTTDGGAFQELTLARIADGLGLEDARIFDAARRSRVGDADPGEESARSSPLAVEDLVAELGELLVALARRSETDFLLVYGQALEAADHLLAHHAGERQRDGREDHGH